MTDPIKPTVLGTASSDAIGLDSSSYSGGASIAVGINSSSYIQPDGKCISDALLSALSKAESALKLERELAAKQKEEQRQRVFLRVQEESLRRAVCMETLEAVALTPKASLLSSFLRQYLGVNKNWRDIPFNVFDELINLSHSVNFHRDAYGFNRHRDYQEHIANIVTKKWNGQLYDEFMRHIAHDGKAESSAEVGDDVLEVPEQQQPDSSKWGTW